MPTQRPVQPPSTPGTESTDWPADLLEVGQVLDAWGTRGWVKIAPDAAEAGALLKAPRLWLTPPEARPGQRRDVAVRLARRHAQAVVALLEGVGDRTAAEALKGWRVHARRADFPPPAKDEYYWADLIGCHATNLQGQDLGEVVGLLDSGAQSVLRLRTPEGTAPPERLIPFVDAYVHAVDIAQRSIVVDWLPDYD